MNIASAVFDSHAEADRAVSELRSAGVSDRAISMVARDEDGSGKTRETDGAGEKAGSVLSKGALGAGVGAALGVAALAIPGVGPLAAAGAIAAAAVPGAALTGTAVGAAVGGLAGLFSKHGVSEEDARYYEGHVNQGGVFVSVDTSEAGGSADQAAEILYRNGGHSSTRARAI